MGSIAFFGGAGRSLKRASEAVLAVLLATMFAAFLVGIVFRYVLNLPMGWAQELSVVCWLWLVLWGSAFVVAERDEIRFDLIIGSASGRTRIAMGIVASLAIIVLYVMSLPAAYSYVTFMKVEKSAYLRIPLDWLYSIYLLFAVAIIVRYVVLLWRLVRGEDVLRVDIEQANSGL